MASSSLASTGPELPRCSPQTLPHLCKIPPASATTSALASQQAKRAAKASPLAATATIASAELAQRDIEAIDIEAIESSHTHRNRNAKRVATSSHGETLMMVDPAFTSYPALTLRFSHSCKHMTPSQHPISPANNGPTYIATRPKILCMPIAPIGIRVQCRHHSLPLLRQNAPVLATTPDPATQQASGAPPTSQLVTTASI